jgi:hypothetical protein
MGWGVRVTPRPLFTPGKDPVPIVQEAGWAPGPVWTGAENLRRLCTGRTVHRGSRVIALPFHDHGTKWGWGVRSRSGRSLPPEKTRYPLYRRLGEPQDRSGQVRKISPPHHDSIPGPSSRYTDYATQPMHTYLCLQKYIQSYIFKIS